MPTSTIRNSFFFHSTRYFYREKILIKSHLWQYFGIFRRTYCWLNFRREILGWFVTNFGFMLIEKIILNLCAFCGNQSWKKSRDEYIFEQSSFLKEPPYEKTQNVLTLWENFIVNNFMSCTFNILLMDIEINCVFLCRIHVYDISVGRY